VLVYLRNNYPLCRLVITSQPIFHLATRLYESFLIELRCALGRKQIDVLLTWLVKLWELGFIDGIHTRLEHNKPNFKVIERHVDVTPITSEELLNEKLLLWPLVL